MTILSDHVQSRSTVMYSISMGNPGDRLEFVSVRPESRGRRGANLAGDLAAVEDGVGGEVGAVQRHRVDVDGVAALVPPEEALPERRQRQRAVR